MKIYFLPSHSENNNSINMIVESLEKNGVTVVNKTTNEKALSKALMSYFSYIKGARVYHFNFLENYAAKRSTKSILLSSVILMWLKSLKLLGCKLVWTMNNKKPHQCVDDGSYYKKFMKKYLDLMEVTFVYCNESIDILTNEYNYDRNKICKVAHGCYVPKYRAKKINEDNKLHILSFGLISQYKNIPMLIKAFNSADLQNTYLRIYGRCDDLNLKREIEEELINNKNIGFYEGFLAEDKVDEIYNWADIAVCPYDKDSMLNSGAAIMGLSQGKMILASNFGYIRDIKNYSFVIAYDYTNDKEHFQMLKGKLKELEKNYIENPEKFKIEGEKAYQFSQQNLDWDSICKKIITYY